MNKRKKPRTIQPAPKRVIGSGRRSYLPPGKPAILHPVPARRFYFAYGSNLNIKAMTSRCTSARKVCSFRLPGWRLVFRHVADIEEGTLTDYVPGGIWEITPDDEIKLDRYEGVRYGKYGQDGGGSYCKLSFPIVTRSDNAVHDVLIYRMNERHAGGVLPPSEWYFNAIVRGYRDFGLDPDMLDAALMRAWDDKNPTSELQSRWNRMGRLNFKSRPRSQGSVLIQQALPFLDIDEVEEKLGTTPEKDLPNEPNSVNSVIV